MRKRKDEKADSVEPEEGKLSRREIIARAAAVAAGAAAAMAVPQAAVAANGDNVQVGQTKTRDSGSNFGTAVVSSDGNVLGAFCSGDQGIYGESHNWMGVHGRGYGSGKIGVRALGEDQAWAIEAIGPTKFSRSGKVMISSGTSSRTVTPSAPYNSPIATTALILATLQGSAGAGVYIAYAQRVSATKFKIVLNKAATKNVKCGWFMIDG